MDSNWVGPYEAKRQTIESGKGSATKLVLRIAMEKGLSPVSDPSAVELTLRICHGTDPLDCNEKGSVTSVRPICRRTYPQDLPQN
ncbi:hypothetical protein PanWU01x14_101760 [Parasponia andersonii]|uniref:Uncharacterized protein n=1 Tax=Parasponia andersonii TaxID=3476 RepID=A0A2P5D2L9_PARAD|nr:hypothetical protein PanWU01x14_101760 [Parasponia andersonii]